jgi:LmbE family N-acetylglucosaminyl deacetylase
MKNTENKILALLAHPDDETLFSGTLALLADKNITAQIVYATSGDAGRDATGQNLSGDTLSIVREEEARESLKTLCLSTPPIFLKYNDGDLKNKIPELKKNISKLINDFQPNVIITFGPDGVSGHPDHIVIGAATDFVFDTKENVDMLLHIAVSETRTKIYNSVAENYLVENAVSDKAINLKIDVEKYIDKRLNAAVAYKTQFTENDCKAIGELIEKAPYEEFIIARKRGMQVAYFDPK